MCRDTLPQCEPGPPGGHQDGPLARGLLGMGHLQELKRLSVRTKYFLATDKEQNISKNFIAN